MARGVSMKVRGPAVPLPTGRNEASRVEFALTGEQRPDPPFTVALRCYQDPDHELPPSYDIRFQVANVLPHLGL
jgi:hypothetical protein